MRFQVQVTRVQTANRMIAAVDEEEALLRVRSELERPYGFVGPWQTTATDVEVTRAPSLGQADGKPIDAPLLLSVADAAKNLGISRASLYELIRTGAIEYVQLGRRRLISRTALARFIEANTHPQ